MVTEQALSRPAMGKCCHKSDDACVQGGVQGHVRSWVDWPEAGLLLLNMRGNRWCGNIGRPHKSNGIFYVVDLQVRLVSLCDRLGLTKPYFGLAEAMIARSTVRVLRY